MADYKINEFGEIVFNNGMKKQKTNPLWEEYVKLEYEVLNNHHNPTDDPIKIARYNELKKHFNIEKSAEALTKAKEKIKQQIIDSDKSPDNSTVYTAMTIFKNTNE